MDWTLEFDGSEVQLTQLDGGQLRLFFSAALVIENMGTAQQETGHVKGLELRFAKATVQSGELPWCIGALSDSTLRLEGQPHHHIPAPFSASGDIRAEFSFRSGTMLCVAASQVQCLLPDDPHWRPSYAC